MLGSKRISYVCGMLGVIMGLLGPIDVFFELGIIELFTKPVPFLSLLILLWLIAPWVNDILPFNNDDDDDY